MGMPVTAEIAVAEIVRENDEEIGLRFLSCNRKAAEGGEKKKKPGQSHRANLPHSPTDSQRSIQRLRVNPEP